jgi:lysophosphatidylcholine acyltransferase / lyso-PAF acetyltransferase
MCMQGTTTNGNYLLPFRTGAFVAGQPVQPVLLSYSRSKWSPSLSWETIEAPRHLFLVLATLFHAARIVELPEYRPSAAEQSDPKLFADNVRNYMVRHCLNFCSGE